MRVKAPPVGGAGGLGVVNMKEKGDCSREEAADVEAAVTPESVHMGEQNKTNKQNIIMRNSGTLNEHE